MTSSPSEPLTPSHDPATGSPVMPQRPRASRPHPPLFAGGEPTPTPPAPVDPGPAAPPEGRRRTRRQGVRNPFASAPRSDGPHGLLDLDGRPDSSDRSTSGPDKPPGKNLAEIREGARNAVQGASELVHDRLARDDIDRRLEVFIADPDDAKNIGDPIGNAINRKLRAAGITTSPDVADIIALAAGLAVYASKQVAKLLEARRLRRAAGGTPDNPDQDHADQPQVVPL